MIRKTDTPGRALAATAMTVALLMGGLPIANAVHFTLVEHTVCGEHGELIHQDEAGHTDEAPVGLSMLPRPGHDDAGHHDCAVLAEVIRVARANSAAVVPAQIAAPSLLPLNAALPYPVGLLRLSPKTSPPAV